MEIFNKYGVLTHPETQKLDDELFTIVKNHLTYLIYNGAIPEQIRAVSHYFSTSVNTACCETVLKTAMNMRKNERGEE